MVPPGASISLSGVSWAYACSRAAGAAEPDWSGGFLEQHDAQPQGVGFLDAVAEEVVEVGGQGVRRLPGAGRAR